MPIPARESTQYDLYSQTFKNDPYPTFAQMRSRDALIAQPGIDGKTMIWFVTGYAEVEQLLRDGQRFVRDQLNAVDPEQAYQPNELEMLLNNHMLNKDGEDHRRLRTLVSQAFTPARARQMRPRIQALADELIAAVWARGQMDLVADFAFQLPTIVISELLGVPVDDRERFKAWSNAFVTPALDAASQARAQELLLSFVQYLVEILNARRHAPGDDLISALLQAEEAGDRLNEAELFSTVILLIVAGHETTVSLIGNATLALLRQPEIAQRLRNEPAQIPAAVEEFLRYDSPVERALVRWAAHDTSLGGQSIKRGELLIGILGAANRDPAQFSQPDVLDLERGPQRHLAFGQGVHYCLGAPLARLETEIAINTLLQKLPDLHLAVPESELVWRTVPMFRGLVALPVAWNTTR